MGAYYRAGVMYGIPVPSRPDEAGDEEWYRLTQDSDLEFYESGYLGEYHDYAGVVGMFVGSGADVKPFSFVVGAVDPKTTRDIKEFAEGCGVHGSPRWWVVPYCG